MTATPTPTKGTPFTIDGVTYFLRYPIIMLGDVKQLLADMKGGEVEASEFVRLLHIGLQQSHPDLSLEEVGNRFELKDVAVIAEALGHAVSGGKAKDPSTPPVPPQQ